MPDYTPVYVPGKVLTLFAGAGGVSGGDLLTISANNTVIRLAFAASQQIIVGVAANDTPANGRVTVYGRGIVHESVAQGTVTAGDLVTVPITGDTAGAQVKTITGGLTAGVFAVDLGAAFSQSTSNAALNAALNALRGVFGICLAGASNPNKCRWMEF